MKFFIELGGDKWRNIFAVVREDRFGTQCIGHFKSVDEAFICIGEFKKKPGSPQQRIVIETESEE